MQKCKNVKTN